MVPLFSDLQCHHSFLAASFSTETRSRPPSTTITRASSISRVLCAAASICLPVGSTLLQNRRERLYRLAESSPEPLCVPERHNTRGAHDDACGQRDERHEQHPRHRYHRRHDAERVEVGVHLDGAAQATCDDIHDAAGERHERRRQHVDERAVDCGDRADECRCPRRNTMPRPANTTPRPQHLRFKRAFTQNSVFGQVKNRSSGRPDDLLRVPQNEKGHFHIQWVH